MAPHKPHHIKYTFKRPLTVDYETYETEDENGLEEGKKPNPGMEKGSVTIENSTEEKKITPYPIG